LKDHVGLFLWIFNLNTHSTKLNDFKCVRCTGKVVSSYRNAWNFNQILIYFSKDVHMWKFWIPNSLTCLIWSRPMDTNFRCVFITASFVKIHLNVPVPLICIYLLSFLFACPVQHIFVLLISSVNSQMRQCIHCYFFTCIIFVKINFTSLNSSQ
jgi:hypothetical protein